MSAAEANAIPVAEFTLASILYAGKRVLAAYLAGRPLGHEVVREDLNRVA